MAKSDHVYESIIKENSKTYIRLPKSCRSLKEQILHRKEKEAAIAIAKALQNLFGVKNV